MSDHRVVHTFAHDGKDYEVRLERSPFGIVVRAWTDNRVANGYAYHADYDTSHDFSRVLGLSIGKEDAEPSPVEPPAELLNPQVQTLAVDECRGTRRLDHSARSLAPRPD